MNEICKKCENRKPNKRELCEAFFSNDQKYNDCPLNSWLAGEYREIDKEQEKDDNER